MTDRTALIRPVPDSFPLALVRHGRPDIDLGLARAQHREYRRVLEETAHVVHVVPTDEAHPDCVFIEDTAVIVGTVAIIARIGAESRRGETPPVAEYLSRRFDIVEMRPPGTLDGGDVFLLDDVFYVGRSSRTNDDGIGQLRAIAHHQGFPVVTVDVEDALHLKSAVLPIDDETVVVTPRSVDESKLEGLRVLYEHDDERNRFSALPLDERTVLVTADAPVTAASVAAMGHAIVPLDVSEIQAADGGLTCMSIMLR
ncbi:MAG TPA: arginine deiminase family protein [Acidimicrobiia bacterium]|nr:arginine deiminase family protein [Acidimicrobiia bacterium]